MLQGVWDGRYDRFCETPVWRKSAKHALFMRGCTAHRHAAARSEASRRSGAREAIDVATPSEKHYAEAILGDVMCIICFLLGPS